MALPVGDTPNARGPKAYVPLIPSTTFTNATQALSEATGNRKIVDLSGFRFARLTAQVTTESNSANTPELRVQYSVDGGSNWSYLIGSAGPAISLAAQGTLTSGWGSIASGALVSECLLRTIQIGGDGSADPVVGNAVLELSA